MKEGRYPYIEQDRRDGSKFTSSCCGQEAKNQEGKPFTKDDIGSPGFCPNPKCPHKHPQGDEGRNEKLCEVWRKSEGGKMLLVEPS